MLAGILKLVGDEEVNGSSGVSTLYAEKTGAASDDDELTSPVSAS